MDGSNPAAFTAAAKRLTALLIQFTRREISTIFTDLAAEVLGAEEERLSAMPMTEDERATRQKCVAIQRAMREIPKWNADEIDRRLLPLQSKRQVIRYIIKLICRANCIVFSALVPAAVTRKIQLEVPPYDQFMHHVLANIAEDIFRAPHLLVNRRSPAEARDSLRAVVAEGIKDTLERDLPYDKLLSQYADLDEDGARAAAEEQLAAEQPKLVQQLQAEVAQLRAKVSQFRDDKSFISKMAAQPARQIRVPLPAAEADAEADADVEAEAEDAFAQLDTHVRPSDSASQISRVSARSRIDGAASVLSALRIKPPAE